MRTVPLLFLAGLTSAAACGGGSSGSGIPDECNPLGGGTSCMMPWPSSAYLKADSTSATGFRLDIPAAAMPTNTNMVSIDPAWFNTWDGFSPSGAIVADFPGGVSADGLPTLDDPSSSLSATSPIVLVNMDTGERAPFFAEVDMNVKDASQRPLIIRPVKRLAPGARYAVGIRNTVKSASGGQLPISDAFAALRDGKSFDHPLMANLTPRYPDIFAKLEAAGLKKADMVLAWDFVTASDTFLTSDLMSMRTDALAAMGNAGANLTYNVQAFSSTNADVYKLVSGTIQSPDFLTDGEMDDSVIRRDASGKPMMSGMRDANFTAIIPACVQTATGPVPVMVFGHGLFGSGQGYLNDSFLQSVAQQYCFVVVAGDFIGLTDRNVGTAATAANDLNNASHLTEKLEQSVIDFISMESIMRGPLGQDAIFKINGNSVVDPSKVYYFGASLGGIMGTVFMGYDPTITRGAIGVPGGPWSMLIERSYAWNALSGPAYASYPDPANFQMLISFLAMHFEVVDPITSAPHLLQDPLPGTPVKQILMYDTLDDCLVTNIASETLARTIGLPVTSPSVKAPFGLVPTTDPVGSGFTIYDEHPTPVPPPYNTPPPMDNGTHSGVHHRPAVLGEIQSFLYNGVVADTCSSAGVAAPCDCATGACDAPQP